MVHLLSPLSCQKAAEQATSRECLLRILTSVRFLARQGLALRGGDADDGNFQQLLRLRCDNAPALKAWLNKKTTTTSWLIQNEIMEMLSHAILRKIISDIHDAKQFALIIDGTQDLGGIEQEAVCIRYVDRKTLKPCETFVGLHERVHYWPVLGGNGPRRPDPSRFTNRVPTWPDIRRSSKYVRYPQWLSSHYYGQTTACFVRTLRCSLHESCGSKCCLRCTMYAGCHAVVARTWKFLWG